MQNSKAMFSTSADDLEFKKLMWTCLCTLCLVGQDDKRLTEILTQSELMSTLIV